MSEFRIVEGDCIEALGGLPDESAQTCITSPPYWGLRDYGHEGQLGLEATPKEYVDRLVAIFAEVRRVLRDDGTVWLNLGDSYAGSWGAQGRRVSPAGISRNQVLNHPKRARNTGSIPPGSGLKAKDLVGIPWVVALALRADGWYLRCEVIWHKPNPMPESVKDRPTRAHEQVFLLSKAPRYYYDDEAIREPDTGQDHSRAVLEGQPSLDPSGGVLPPHRGLRAAAGRNGLGRNKRSVWTVATRPFPGAHFATFPPDLIEPCVLAGAPEGATVLDPFAGAGTTGLVALRHDRDFLGIELNPEYAQMARERIADDAPLLNVEADLGI